MAIQGNKKLNKKNHIIALVLLLLIVTALIIAFKSQLTLKQIQENAELMHRYLELNWLKGLCIFIGIYFCLNTLPIPFISVPTVIAGFLFGNIHGLIIVSFSNALGSTVLFLLSRYFLKNWIRSKLSGQNTLIAQSIESDKFWHATSLRLIPGIPFCITTMALGLTQLSTLKFYASTQLGMLFILFIYVNAGTQLTQLNSLNDLFSPTLITSMLLLAFAPLLLSFISKKLLKRFH